MEICKGGCCINCRALLEKDVKLEFIEADTTKARDDFKATSKLIRQELEELAVAFSLFNVDKLEKSQMVVYPLEDDFANPVWLLPSLGYMAQDFFEMGNDEVSVPVFMVQVSKEWGLKYNEMHRYDIMFHAISSTARGLSDYVYEAMWRTVIPMVTSGFSGLGIIPPVPPQIVNTGSDGFTKEVFESMAGMFKDSGRKLKSILLSPEDMSDIEQWAKIKINADTGQRYINLYDDDHTQTWSVYLYESKDLGMKGKYNICGHSSEFGPFRADEGNKFNDYQIVDPSIISSDGQLVMAGETQVYGFSDDVKSYFHLPITEEYTAFSDPGLVRRQRVGFYGWMKFGMACTNPQCTLMAVINRKGQEPKNKRVRAS
jgi:hypothetical protein